MRVFSWRRLSLILAKAGCRGDFRLIENSSSLMVEVGGKRFLCGRSYTGKGMLKLIAKVKSDVLSRYRAGFFELRDVEPVYFRLNQDRFSEDSGRISGVEFDMNKAYLYTAFRLGMLSVDVCNSLLSVSGETRKKVLGTLGAKKKIYSYRSWKLVGTEESYNPFFRSVWLNICAGLDDTMNTIAAANWMAFYFYWFDNMFLSSKPCRGLEHFDSWFWKERMFDASWRSYAVAVEFRFDDGRLFCLPKRKIFMRRSYDGRTELSF